jgi:hypothetical protein
MASISRVSSIPQRILRSKIQLESLTGESRQTERLFPHVVTAPNVTSNQKRGFCVEGGDGVQLTKEGRLFLPAFALRAIAQRLHTKSTRATPKNAH